MATITNTYARAFADVIFDSHLDPAKTLQESQSIAELVAQNKELREVWESPAIPPIQKRRVLDAIVSRESHFAPSAQFPCGFDRSWPNAFFIGNCE